MGSVRRKASTKEAEGQEGQLELEEVTAWDTKGTVHHYIQTYMHKTRSCMGTFFTQDLGVIAALLGLLLPLYSLIHIGDS